MRLLLPLLCLTLALSSRAADSPDLTPIKKWIARQDDFHSVQADFTQTRALKALRSPVAVPGHIWFTSPNTLRWELGDPAKTIVLRRGESWLVIQPAKKKVEHFAGGTDLEKSGPARGFAMMSFPLAKDFADFQKQFEVLAVSVDGTHCHLEILPRDAQARKFLSALKIDFDTTTGHLISFEMATKDGSSMRNDFSSVKVNQKIDRKTFEFDTTGYEVVEGKN